MAAGYRAWSPNGSWKRVPLDEIEGLKQYVEEIQPYKVLDAEAQRRFGRRYQRTKSKVAFDVLVRSNLRYVVRVATYYAGYGVPVLELVSEGNMGLMEVIPRWDPNRVKLITYATWWIRKCILSCLARQIGIIRLPGQVQQDYRKLRKTRYDLASELNREPDDTEIANRMEKPTAWVTDLRDKVRRRNGVSLSTHVYVDDPTDLENSEETSHAADQQLLLELASSTTEILDFLRESPDNEQEVLKSRFGIDGRPQLTLKEIGEKMGVSRERIRQIEVQAKKRLRRKLELNRARTTPDTITANDPSSATAPTTESEAQSRPNPTPPATTNGPAANRPPRPQFPAEIRPSEPQGQCYSTPNGDFDTPDLAPFTGLQPAPPQDSPPAKPAAKELPLPEFIAGSQG